MYISDIKEKTDRLIEDLDKYLLPTPRFLSDRLKEISEDLEYFRQENDLI